MHNIYNAILLGWCLFILSRINLHPMCMVLCVQTHTCRREELLRVLVNTNRTILEILLNQTTNYGELAESYK